MDVLESDVHGTDVHAQVFEFCEEVVEVVGCEGELRRLDIVRGEGEVWAREGVCEGDCRRGGCSLCCLWLAIFVALALQLQGVCEISFMSSYKVGEILSRSTTVSRCTGDKGSHTKAGGGHMPLRILTHPPSP